VLDQPLDGAIVAVRAERKVNVLHQQDSAADHGTLHSSTIILIRSGTAWLLLTSSATDPKNRTSAKA